MSDNVNYLLKNRARLAEAVKESDDDESLMFGTLRCISCGDEHQAVQPFPDWMAYPHLRAECESCGKMECVFVNNDDLALIPSRRNQVPDFLDES